LDGALTRNEFKETAAFSEQRESWDARALQKYVDALAAGLVEHGYKPGSKVAAWMSNEAELACLTLAAARVGVTVVAVDANASFETVDGVLSSEQPRGIMFSQRVSGEHRGVKMGEWFPETLDAHWTEGYRSKSRRYLRHVINTGNEAPEGVMRYREMVVMHPMPHPVDVLRDSIDESGVTLVTVGADGARAEYSHKQLSDAADGAVKTLSMTGEDVVAVTAPLSGVLGVSAGLLASLKAGARVVVPCKDFNAGKALRHMTKQRATVLVASGEQVGAMAEALAGDAGGKYDLSALRVGVVEGGSSHSSLAAAKLVVN
jgi:acyl-coenzyme A synthetase/AMP-(fatty) acid ligase